LNGSPCGSTTAAEHVLTSGGANLRAFKFDNVRWALVDGAAVASPIDSVVFTNISNLTAAQFAYNRSTTTNATLQSWDFQTVPTTPGVYIALTGPDTLAMTGTTPSSNGGFLSIAGAGRILGWAGPASVIVPDSGSGQVGTAGATLAQAFVATVTDAFGNPVAGHAVAWAVLGGGGSLGGVTTTTDANGRVRATLTLGAIGAQAVTATAAGIGTPAVFTANASVAFANVTWTGAVDNNWVTAGNWSPAAVPTASDSVFVPPGGTQPTIFGGGPAVKALYLAPGASLALSGVLTVSGTLDVGGSITGTGAIGLSGVGALRGLIASTISTKASFARYLPR